MADRGADADDGVERDELANVDDDEVDDEEVDDDDAAFFCFSCLSCLQRKRFNK